MPNISAVNDHAAAAVQDPRYPRFLSLLESGARVVQFAALGFNGGGGIVDIASTFRSGTSAARLPRDAYKLHDGSFAQQRFLFHSRDFLLVVVHLSGLVTISKKIGILKESTLTQVIGTAGKYCWLAAMACNFGGQITSPDPKARDIAVSITELVFPVVEVLLVSKVSKGYRIAAGVGSGAILFLHKALPNPMQWERDSDRAV